MRMTASDDHAGLRAARLNAPEMPDALEAQKKNGAKVMSIAPKLAAWMETAIPESLMHLPGGLRKELQTSNGPYAHQPGTPRPFKVIGLFINDASCPRLASTILMEIRDA